MVRWMAVAAALVVLALPGPGTAQSRDDILAAQEALSDYGVGSADGVWGPTSQAALKAYQKDWKLPQTGELTSEMVHRLKGEHPDTELQTTKVVGRDCEIWLEPVAQSVVTWSGDCVEGKAAGDGELQWRSVVAGVEQSVNYVGQMVGGARHGQGVYTWADGSRYEGGWVDGKRSGKGVYTSLKGNRYEGEWLDGLMHGYGVISSAKGKRYEGKWRHGKQHGQGTFYWDAGHRCSGTFHDGNLIGTGQGVYQGRSTTCRYNASRDTWTFD